MKRTFLFLSLMIALLANAQNLPFITKVYDFLPAPGQFVNHTPKYNYSPDSEPLDSLMARVEKAICGTMTIHNDTVEMPDGSIVIDTDTVIDVKPGLISLGAFGGYVVFGFDHPVVNIEGEYDLQIFGNSFQAASSSSSGGSSEPGIVMVSRDMNGNGIPDDPWYELAGSEHNHPKTQKNFTITYYKPDDSQFGTLKPNQYHNEYIRWTCNSVDSLQEGYVRKNYFHSQSYWPQWYEGETLTFTGTKLRCNAVDESGQGTYYVQHFVDWGYVDNRPDWHYGYGAGDFADDMSLGFKIDWAVDNDGNPVNLKTIDFVKVYSGVLQDCGWIGETSTEVAGAIDLHPDAVAPHIKGDVNADGKVNVSDVTTLINMILGVLPIDKPLADVNSDGNVNVSDVTALINMILGILVL